MEGVVMQDKTIEEMNYNIPASCLTFKLKEGLKHLNCMRGEAGYETKDVKEVIELDKKGYLEMKIAKKPKQ